MAWVDEPITQCSCAERWNRDCQIHGVEARKAALDEVEDAARALLDEVRGREPGRD